MGKNVVRTILCTILSFLLSLALVGLAILFIIRLSCFDRNSLYRNLISSAYYQNVLSEIYEKAESITLTTGLSVEVLNNSMVLDEVKNDINNYIKVGFRGETYEPDTTLIEKRLRENINDYLAQERIEPNQEQKKNIKLYVSSVTEEYTNFIKIPLFNFFITAKENYSNIYIIGLASFIITIIIVVSMLLIMNQWIHRALRYMAYSTTAAAFMIATAPAALLYTGLYKKLQLSPQYFYDFAMTFLTDIFRTMIYCSFCLAVISIILLVKIRFIKIKKADRKGKSVFE